MKLLRIFICYCLLIGLHSCKTEDPWPVRPCGVMYLDGTEYRETAKIPYGGDWHYGLFEVRHYLNQEEKYTVRYNPGAFYSKEKDSSIWIESLSFTIQPEGFTSGIIEFPGNCNDFTIKLYGIENFPGNDTSYWGEAEDIDAFRCKLNILSQSHEEGFDKMKCHMDYEIDLTDSFGIHHQITGWAMPHVLRK